MSWRCISESEIDDPDGEQPRSPGTASPSLTLSLLSSGARLLGSFSSFRRQLLHRKWLVATRRSLTSSTSSFVANLRFVVICFLCRLKGSQQKFLGILSQKRLSRSKLCRLTQAKPHTPLAHSSQLDQTIRTLELNTASQAQEHNTLGANTMTLKTIRPESGRRRLRYRRTDLLRQSRLEP